MIEWLKVEFHCHTICSADSLAAPEALIAAARRRRIDRLVITDHNTLGGALRMKEIDPQRIIVGEEIVTTKGELLAFFVHEEVPARLDPRDTIDRLRSQGAFISVSHPFDYHRKGWQPDDLMEIAPLVDAIEVFNARCLKPAFNVLAGEFARKVDLPGTVGSDAHTICELGRATMRLPYFDDADSLRRVIRQGQPAVRLSSPWVHFSSTYAKLYKQILKPGAA